MSICLIDIGVGQVAFFPGNRHDDRHASGNEFFYLCQTGQARYLAFVTKCRCERRIERPVAMSIVDPIVDSIYGSTDARRWLDFIIFQK